MNLQGVSIVWDKEGKFFQVWTNNFKGDGKSHAETIARQIGGTYLHVDSVLMENARLTRMAALDDKLARDAIVRAETAEARLATATDLLRQTRKSLKRAPFNLFIIIDGFLADSETPQGK